MSRIFVRRGSMEAPGMTPVASRKRDFTLVVARRFANCFAKSLRRDEQVAFVLASLMLLFGAVHEYSWWRQQKPMPPLFVDTQSPSGNGAPASISKGRVLVDVAGAVKRPGIQQWPAGTRVFQAVEKAGGATPAGDLQSLNLAARLVDGQKIRVPVRGEARRASGDSGYLRAAVSGDALDNSGKRRIARNASEKEGGAPGRVINVNSASATELDVLPGVGPATATRIVESRVRQGRFRSLEDLDRVKGLGPKKLEALRPHISF